jgi:hypothetical protein
MSDTPPGTSDEHLTVIGALKNSRPDGAVVVTTPHSLSLGTVRKEVTYANRSAGKQLTDVHQLVLFLADQLLRKNGHQNSWYYREHERICVPLLWSIHFSVCYSLLN